MMIIINDEDNVNDNDNDNNYSVTTFTEGAHYVGQRERPIFFSADFHCD